MNRFKKVLKFLLGESFVELYHAVKEHRTSLILCDPVTMGVLTAIIGTTAVVGGTGAGIAALSGAFDKKEENANAATITSTTDTGAVTDVGSTEEQAAQRKLARLSKYFTSPTGVLDVPTGSTGIF